MGSGICSATPSGRFIGPEARQPMPARNEDLHGNVEFGPTHDVP